MNNLYIAFETAGPENIYISLKCSGNIMPLFEKLNHVVELKAGKKTYSYKATTLESYVHDHRPYELSRIDIDTLRGDFYSFKLEYAFNQIKFCLERESAELGIIEIAHVLQRCDASLTTAQIDALRACLPERCIPSRPKIKARL